MPTPASLNSLEVDFTLGYYPSAPALSPEGVQRTIRRGSNCWLRPGGKIEVAKGLLEVSSQNVGARIFAADIQRASIAGGLVGSRLPFAGLLRYQNAVLFFLSENTSAQVYLNETAVTGLTTSATAGRLRVAIPDGVGGYDVFDAGLSKPILPSGPSGAQMSSGNKGMRGFIGVALSRWRSKTNAIGQPSEIVYNNLPAPNFAAGSVTALNITLPAAVTGQDGWVLLGTHWGDESGTLRVVRRFRIRPRGTFTATNASATITGLNTLWTQDLALGDTVEIDGDLYTVNATSDTTATIIPNFTGSTDAGKVMDMFDVSGDWFDGELGEIINRDIIAPPRAAAVLQYAGRVFLWGVPDTADPFSAAVTGNALVAMLDNNPEHTDPTRGIPTASGSDLVNVLAGDGPMYLMTTTSLEVVSFTSDPSVPYIIRVVAEPGFKATSNGVLYKDWFYGFNNRPLRTRARENIDVEFAEPVWSDMETWDAQRVIVAVDPKNEAVLYVFDDGAASVVIPYMTQLGRWSPPLNFSARIIDAAVVNGTLYVTYLSGGNYRVNEWEGGAGIGGTRYVASQYYDTAMLNRGRLKRLVATGKMGSLSVYAATPDAAVPDVGDLGAAAETFPLSDTDKSEPEIHTQIEARAFAFRADFTSNDGTFDKLIARGLPKSEGR